MPPNKHDEDIRQILLPIHYFEYFYENNTYSGKLHNQINLNLLSFTHKTTGALNQNLVA
jgi:hypothetical protein